MLYERQRLWLKHKYREETNHCPLCGASIKWIYDGDSWIPCDKEPVYYMLDYHSRICIVRRKTLVEGVRIYNPAMDIRQCQMGLLPHVYSCTETNKEWCQK